LAAPKTIEHRWSSSLNTTSALKLWWIWFGSLVAISLFIGVAYFVAYSGEIVGLAADIFNMGMYAIIVVPGVLAIWYSFNEAKFIAEQTKIASTQVEMLLQLNDVQSFLDKAQPSIFRSHIESLFRIFQMSSDISQDNLIEILQARLLSRNSLIEISASILVTLGLIGTIAGLIVMANSLGGILESAGGIPPTELMSKIAGPGGPLSGLGVAFYTTLFGAVLGGVFLRIFTIIVDSAVTQYTAHIAELTEVNVLPFMKQLARTLEAGGYYSNHAFGEQKS
jgi:hypothetical protein